jgi:hypothetical protein
MSFDLASFLMGALAGVAAALLPSAFLFYTVFAREDQP